MSEETKNFTREELDEFRSLLNSIKGMNERIAKLEEHGNSIALEKEQREAIVEDILKVVAPEDDEKKKVQESIEQRLAAVETAMSRPGQGGDSKSDEPDERREAFLRYIKSCGRDISGLEQKTLSVDVDTGAGYLVYDDMRTSIIEAEREFDVMRQVANVVPTDGKEVVWPTKPAHAVATYLGGEAGTATADTALSFGQKRIAAHEAMTFIDVTQKLLRASFVDIEAMLKDEFGQAFAVLFGASYISGDSGSEAEGFLTNSNVQANYEEMSIDANDEIDEQMCFAKIMADLKVGYWPNCKWIMNRTTYGQICALLDSAGRTLFGSDLNTAVPLQLRGKPVLLSPNMPDPSNGAYPIAYGDFKRGYTIVDDVAMSIQIDPYTQNTTATVRILGYAASGGGVTDDDAIYVLKAVS